MALTNREKCVSYLKETVLPYLRQHCKLDAEHLEHRDGENGVHIPLDEPKDYGDIKGYIGIAVVVEEKYNPNIEPLNNPPTISGHILSNDDEFMDFLWYSLEEMAKGINELK